MAQLPGMLSCGLCRPVWLRFAESLPRDPAVLEDGHSVLEGLPDIDGDPVATVENLGTLETIYWRPLKFLFNFTCLNHNHASLNPDDPDIYPDQLE